MRIGFLGLGNMGGAMARNLLLAQHQVTVYNRRRTRAEAFVKEGARLAETPAASARNQELIISMLADDAAVESVIFGSDGAIQGLMPRALHISMSTISPDLATRLAKAHREREQGYVSAPVFGRPDAAAAARLFIVAAGPRDVLAKAQPIFEVLGQRWFEVGENAERANFVKLFGNFLIACAIEGLGEVFAVALKAGIDPKIVLQVLTSTLFGCPIYNNYGAILAERRFTPPGFKLPLGLKDVRLALDAAAKLNAPMAFGEVVRDHFLEGIAKGYSELDWSALAQVVAESAGLPKYEAKGGGALG